MLRYYFIYQMLLMQGNLLLGHWTKPFTHREKAVEQKLLGSFIWMLNALWLIIHTELINWKKNPSLSVGSSFQLFLMKMYLYVPPSKACGEFGKAAFSCNTFVLQTSFANSRVIPVRISWIGRPWMIKCVEAVFTSEKYAVACYKCLLCLL